MTTTREAVGSTDPPGGAQNWRLAALSRVPDDPPADVSEADAGRGSAGESWRAPFRPKIASCPDISTIRESTDS